MRIARVLRALALAALAGACPAPARAQSPDTLLPEQSEAKAKQVMRQAIQALGGPAYLGVKDSTCSGRTSSFAHSGAVNGTVKFVRYEKLPDKDRSEYSYKTYTDVIIAELHKTNTTMEVHNGDKGWSLTGGGVEEWPPDVLAANQEQRKRNIDVLLRERLNEPGLVFRWAGLEIIDLHRVEWVEVSDTEHHTIRVAFDEQTHLPSRLVYQTLDPATRERNEETEFFSNFHTIQGVGLPFQRARMRNGLKFFQVFYDDCKFNTGLSDDLFTRAALEERFAKTGKGKKPK